MDNSIKKLEEQIAFLQYEVSQISDELHSQQQEVLVLKKKINELENIDESTILMKDKKPPHY